MNLRNMLLAVVGVVMLAGSFSPAEAQHHRRHHRRHHYRHHR